MASSALLLGAVLGSVSIAAAAPVASQTASAVKAAPARAAALGTLKASPVSPDLDVEPDVFGQGMFLISPSRFSIPAGTTASARKAVSFALAQRGKPYKFNTTGPRTYDCSGLTMKAWANAHKNIGRTTGNQIKAGKATSASNLRPGDLILVHGGGHVGMYIGRGLVIHAPHTGTVVKIVHYTAFKTLGVNAIRHIA